MHRCFVDFKVCPFSVIEVTGDEAKHIGKVLRFAVGDKLEVCDGSGMKFDAQVKEIHKNDVILSIGEGRMDDAEPEVEVYLFTGLSKGAKMDLVIQKSVELGVTAVIPVETEFTVAKEGKTERWQRIAFEAAKQCKRSTVPKIYDVMNFNDAVKKLKSFDACICAYEKEKSFGVTEALQGIEAIKTCGIFVGAEGGFSEKETEYMAAQGVPTVSMGKRILRTETAAIVLLAIVMHHFGELS